MARALSVRSVTPIREILHEADANLVKRFAEYHLLNPHVYAGFVRRAFKMKAAGRRKYSQWVIIQAMRWEYDLGTHRDVFKINNDFIALYARLAIHEHAALAGFFGLRSMKPSDRRSSADERYRKRK
jgi:hypothetical protein